MCGPAALPVIAAASAGLAAIGTVYTGIQAQKQGNYQQKVAEQNAKLSAEAANQETENTQQAALQHYRKLAALQGQQRVQMAAGGLDVNFGNAADLTADTEMLGREDARRIYDQGAQNVRGFDIEGRNYRSQGQAARQQGSGAMVGSLFSAAGTALGGAQQYRQLKVKMG